MVRLHIIDASLDCLTEFQCSDYLWSLEKLCSENRRMLSAEVAYTPWIGAVGGMDHKIEKRLGRLIGACCILDVQRGRQHAAKAFASHMLDWLCTKDWQNLCREETSCSATTSRSGAVFEWPKAMLLQHPARDLHELLCQKQFVLLLVEQVSFAYGFLKVNCK